LVTRRILRGDMPISFAIALTCISNLSGALNCAPTKGAMKRTPTLADRTGLLTLAARMATEMARGGKLT